MTLSDYEKIVAALRGKTGREDVKRYAKINWTKVKNTIGKVGRMILPGINAIFPESIPFNGLVNRGLDVLDQPSRMGSDSNTWTPVRYSAIYFEEKQ